MRPSSLAAAWFAASVIANPITHPPAATVTEAPDMPHNLDCYHEIVMLQFEAPSIRSRSQVMPWLWSEVSKILATATAAPNKCENWAPFLSTAAPRSSQIFAEWSSALSEHSSWVSRNSGIVASLASSCPMYGLNFELLAVNNKAGCESAYRKYGVSIPTLTLPPATFLDRYLQSTTATPTPASPASSASKATVTAVPPLRSENGGRAAKGNGMAIAAAAAAAAAGGVALL